MDKINKSATWNPYQQSYQLQEAIQKNVASKTPPSCKVQDMGSVRLITLKPCKVQDMGLIWLMMFNDPGFLLHNIKYVAERRRNGYQEACLMD